MAIDRKKFWGKNHFKHPKLTNDMVAQAEAQLGVKLPTTYINLLKIQNGGYTRKFGFPMKRRTSWAKDHVPLDDLAGIIIDPDFRSPLNIMKSPDMSLEWDVPPKQVLLTGDGHWWITLDYRKSKTPRVRWIDTEMGQDMKVADTFADFIKGLKPEKAFIPPMDEFGDPI